MLQIRIAHFIRHLSHSKLPGSQQRRRFFQPHLPNEHIGGLAGQRLDLPIHLDPAHKHVVGQLIHGVIRIFQATLDAVDDILQKGFIERVHRQLGGIDLQAAAKFFAHLFPYPDQVADGQQLQIERLGNVIVGHRSSAKNLHKLACQLPGPARPGALSGINRCWKFWTSPANETSGFYGNVPVASTFEPYAYAIRTSPGSPGGHLRHPAPRHRADRRS
ncbi:MAG: hypothetical protein ABIQ93_07880 [Saprospiraceae bacterium]